MLNYSLTTTCKEASDRTKKEINTVGKKLMKETEC